MKLVESILRTAYRFTPDGQRVYIPLVWVPLVEERQGFAVPDGHRERFERRLVSSALLLVLVIPAAVLMAGQAIWIVFPMLLVLQHALTKWFVTSGLPRDRFKLQELQHGEVSGDVAANTGAASRRVYWTMLYLSAFIALFALETLLLGAGTVGWILLLIAGLQLAYFGYAIRVSR